MKQQCGLCGKSEKLTQTECCGQWICDDEDQYVLFSFARNSCSRNHRRYTLCGFHHSERHEGNWKACALCRDGFEAEMYVYYGTNEYNFEKLQNTPSYEPTRCAKCRTVISLGEDGYSMKAGQYFCVNCPSPLSRKVSQALARAFSREQKKRMGRRLEKKIYEGPASIDKDLFAKLSKPWPAVKWIRMLLEQNPVADRWMLDVMDGFLRDEDAFCGRMEWPVIHIVRITGEKQLIPAIRRMVEIYNRHSEEYNRVLVDEILLALEKMGPSAFKNIFRAFEQAGNGDIKTTYLGILCKLGVRDEKIRKALLECFDYDPGYVAGSMADYGDKTLLPFLCGQVWALVPTLKKQMPTTRAESEELELYIDLCDAIVSLERESVCHPTPFSVEKYYQRKGKPIANPDSKFELESRQYGEALEKLNRRFFEGDVVLFRKEDDDAWDDDNEMPPVVIPFRREDARIGRNDPCSCGSGKKFKKCCSEKMH